MVVFWTPTSRSSRVPLSEVGAVSVSVDSLYFYWSVTSFIIACSSQCRYAITIMSNLSSAYHDLSGLSAVEFYFAVNTGNLFTMTARATQLLFLLRIRTTSFSALPPALSLSAKGDGPDHPELSAAPQGSSAPFHGPPRSSGRSLHRSAVAFVSL